VTDDEAQPPNPFVSNHSEGACQPLSEVIWILSDSL